VNVEDKKKHPMRQPWAAAFLEAMVKEQFKHFEDALYAGEGSIQELTARNAPALASLAVRYADELIAELAK